MDKVQNASTKDDQPIRDLPLACADEDAAIEFMEKHRWGENPACPTCGSLSVYQMRARDGSREANYRWRCTDCKDRYSVRKGTVLEDSRIPLRHWCFAFWRASTSKKGVSALEIHRQTGLCYKSSLFLMHRIRYALGMSEKGTAPLSGTVEVDETFVKTKPTAPLTDREPGSETPAVMALVERCGRVRTQVIADVTAKTLKSAIRENVHQTARIMTDEFRSYHGIGKEFAGHETVNHSHHEYSRDHGDITTNAVEGYFSILKRGLGGIYHNVSSKHLPLYLNEFSWRYNNRALTDGERTVSAIKATEGVKLYYKTPIIK